MLGRILAPLVVIAAWLSGWIVGSVHPAPATLIARLDPSALESQTMERLRLLDFGALQRAMGEAQYSELKSSIVYSATRAGDLMVIERNDAHADGADAPDAALAPLPSVAPAAAPRAGAPQKILLCPRMTVSNAPKADAAGIVAAPATVDVNGVALAVDPTQGACLSSGFGARSGRTHKGVDYYSADGGPILAAADGVILEMKYRDDYGNMLLIDHGEGVYTRYAHLSSFQKGVGVGVRVRAGDQLGLMGNTAGYRVPVHLHYEVLLGDYSNPKASFGLTPENPFQFPARKAG